MLAKTVLNNAHLVKPNHIDNYNNHSYIYIDPDAIDFDLDVGSILVAKSIIDDKKHYYQVDRGICLCDLKLVCTCIDSLVKKSHKHMSKATFIKKLKHLRFVIDYDGSGCGKSDDMACMSTKDDVDQLVKVVRNYTDNQKLINEALNLDASVADSADLQQVAYATDDVDDFIDSLI